MTRRRVMDASNKGGDSRPCDECGEVFAPRNSGQRFCARGACRQRWHRREQAKRLHACSLCGLLHAPIRERN